MQLSPQLLKRITNDHCNIFTLHCICSSLNKDILYNILKTFMYLTHLLIVIEYWYNIITANEFVMELVHISFYIIFFFLKISLMTKVLKHVIFQKLMNVVQRKQVVKKKLGFSTKSWKFWPWSQATMITLMKKVMTLM